MKDLSKESDLTLFQRLNGGDAAAFTEIFNRYRAPLFKFVYKKVRDEEAARDMVQDVFVKLWSKRGEINITTSLSSYLYKAAHNRSLDALKQQTVREEYFQAFQHVLDQTAPAADHLIREQDMEELIEREIAALPERMREVINLRRKEYLSNREIAERMEISEQTVETHFKKALRILRLRFRLILPLAYLAQWWLHL